jgi:hypothetical protein
VWTQDGRAVAASHSADPDRWQRGFDELVERIACRLFTRGIPASNPSRNNSERCRAAGVPDDIKFATKPALAREMITRALDAGIPAAWVAGDEVYGADSKLRAALQERAIGYVLAVACDHQVTTLAGKHPARALSRRLPTRAWNRLSAGVGAKGHRWYDWADRHPGRRHRQRRRWWPRVAGPPLDQHR